MNDIVGTLCAGSYPGKLAHQDIMQGLYPVVPRGGQLQSKGQYKGMKKYAVRRLTPMECERLQGYPDHWTDIGEWVDSLGKKHKDADSPRYKALGNSIALPFWDYLLGNISEELDINTEGRHTLGSLFDGIGGFPLCWESHNGKGSARWASEIEEFPIAVTKLRFPEEELV